MVYFQSISFKKLKQKESVNKICICELFDIPYILHLKRSAAYRYLKKILDNYFLKNSWSFVYSLDSDAGCPEESRRWNRVKNQKFSTESSKAKSGNF